MKKNGLNLVCVSLLICAVFAANAQAVLYKPSPKQTEKKPLPTPRNLAPYLGFGVGANALTGLIGFYTEVPLSTRVSVIGGLGLSSWGTKVGAGLQISANEKAYGSAINLSYVHAFGLSEFEFQFEENGEMKLMTLNDAPTLNLGYLYAWRMGVRSKFFLTAGYSFALVDLPVVVKRGTPLTLQEKNAMAFAQPGGLMFGFGFLFGT